MKSHLKNYVIVILMSFILLLVINLVMTLYIHFDELDLAKDYKSPLFIARNVVFLFLGICIGYKEHQSGVFHGLLCSLSFIILSSLISFLSLDKYTIDWLKYLINILLASFGGIIGVNMPKNLKSQH